MTHRIRRKQVQSKRIYHINNLSLTQNNDLQHQKMWNGQIEDAKHIQQQKQIDRMLSGIIKQRLFGNFLSQESRISNQGYYTLDKITKERVNPQKYSFRKKIKPLANLNEYKIIPRERGKSLNNRTIDVSLIGANQGQNSTFRHKRPSFDETMRRSRKSYSKFRKILSIDNYQQFPNHFRKIIGNFSTMIYDMKINKEMILKYNKKNKIICQSILQKFLFFFNFSAPMNIKQFGKWIQNAANCSMKETSFFVFQALDESHNGFLTISDLFRSLQDSPDNPSIEKELYEVMQMIKKVSEQLDRADLDFREIKPTVQQILIRNHELKIESLRDLIKQSSKQLVRGECVKSTTYHISLQALEHDSYIRQKLNKLQVSQRANKARLKNDELNMDNKTMKQDGIRYMQYGKSYQYRRPKMFTTIIKMLVGEDLNNTWE